MKKLVLVLVLLIALILVLGCASQPATQCGNGVCESGENETCENDCPPSNLESDLLEGVMRNITGLFTVQTNKGILQINVFDGNKPLAGASVKIKNTAGNVVAKEQTTSTGKISKSLDFGNYIYVVSKTGYVTSEWENIKLDLEKEERTVKLVKVGTASDNNKLDSNTVQNNDSNTPQDNSLKNSIISNLVPSSSFVVGKDVNFGFSLLDANKVNTCMVSINKVDTNVSKLSTQNQVKVSFKKRTEVEWFVKCVMKDGNKIESTKKNLSVYPAPLYIKDCNQLQGINNNLNGTYILTNNIDCTGQSFVTIGKGQAFTGAIEGEGYKIIGLKINSTGINKETGSDDDLGLIGSTSGSINLGYAKIRNLTLSKVDINGDRSVGALIGDALGTTIENVTVDGKVFGSDHVGGLIGSASDVNLINCASSASISNAKNDVGGLIGFASNVIMTGSSSSASITNAGERIGGLVGYLNSGNVTKSKFTGKITINKNSTILNSDAGGIAGYASNSVRITDSSFTGSINGADCVGGIIGTIGAPIELSQNTSKGTLKSVGQKGIQIGCDFSK